MDTDVLVGLLAQVPGTRVSHDGEAITAHLPTIGDTVRLAVGDVLGAERVVVPTGAPGVQLGVRRGHEELPLIVTVDDVVFMPAYAADMLQPGAPVRVPFSPPLVAYSEMRRDVDALGHAVQRGGQRLDAEILAATVLLHRCFLAGAVRVGLWPVGVAARWQHTWMRVGADLPLAPFRADPIWDLLLADADSAVGTEDP